MVDKNNDSLLAERLQRIQDAVALKEPDRVPLMDPGTNSYPHYEAGYTIAEVVYDLEKAKDAIRKFQLHYQLDSGFIFGSCFEGQGSMLELSKCKNYQWAGMPGGVIDKNSIQQFIEYPLLEEDEYHELLTNRTAAAFKKILPRKFGVFEPMKNINFDSMMVPDVNYKGIATGFARQDVQEMLKDLAKLDDLWADYGKQIRSFSAEIEELGFPVMRSAPLTFPFDFLSDFLRGTVGASMDIYDNPDQVYEFLEQHVLLEIDLIKRMPARPGRFAFIPMHKGMDGFLSDEQYQKYYWKFLLQIIDAITKIGLVPYLYTEGKYNTRLKFLEQLPKGKTVVHFEEVDMAAAKKALDGVACITGNYPYFLLTHGTKQQVIDEAKRLLDICAPGGGYMFDFDGGLYECKQENLEVLIETVKEYGKY